MPIVLESHDPGWAVRFAAERSVLEQVLAPWLAGGVHHVGSTSVPGLAAKPVLDMIAGVADLDAARPAVDVLRALDWVHAPHRPRALWFFRTAVPGSSDATDHTHHLHLTDPGSDLWRERLAFRDALRADPAPAAAYADLKRRLAAAHPDDGPAYAAGKRAFVADVLARVGIALARPGQG